MAGRSAHRHAGESARSARENETSVSAPRVRSLVTSQRRPVAPIVASRNAVHRRALAFSDALAAMIAFAIPISVMGSNQLRPASLAILPVVLLVGKLCGLYDRDELLLHKTTADE